MKDYEYPPEPINTETKKDSIAWREHSLYLLGAADTYAAIVSLFGEGLSKELKEFCVTGEKLTREQAEKESETAKDISMKLWKEKNED